jgi:hypothetical protein
MEDSQSERESLGFQSGDKSEHLAGKHPGVWLLMAALPVFYAFQHIFGSKLK